MAVIWIWRQYFPISMPTFAIIVQKRLRTLRSCTPKMEFGCNRWLTGKIAYLRIRYGVESDRPCLLLSDPETSLFAHRFSPFVHRFSLLWECSRTAQIQHKVILINGNSAETLIQKLQSRVKVVPRRTETVQVRGLSTTNGVGPIPYTLAFSPVATEVIKGHSPTIMV